MKKTSFVVAFFVAAALVGCGSKNKKSSTMTGDQGSGSAMMGSDMGSGAGSAATGSDMSGSAAAPGGAAGGSGM